MANMLLYYLALALLLQATVSEKNYKLSLKSLRRSRRIVTPECPEVTARGIIGDILRDNNKTFDDFYKETSTCITGLNALYADQPRCLDILSHMSSEVISHCSCR